MHMNLDYGPGTNRPIPVRIGSDCLRHLCQSGVTLLPALALLPLAVHQFLAADSALSLPWALLGLLLLWPGLRSIKMAWSHRPVDLLLSQDAIRVCGGPTHGQIYLWAQLNPKGFCLYAEDEGQEIRVETLRPERQSRFLRLYATTVESKRVFLAEGESGQEQLILVGLYRYFSRIVAVRKPYYSKSFFGCPICQKLITLHDQAELTCPGCARSIELGQELRARVRGVLHNTDSRSASLRQLDSCRRQLGAARFSWLLFALIPPVWFIWALCLAGVQQLHATYHLNGLDAFSLVSLPIVVLFLLACVLSWLLQARLLGWVLSTSFAARSSLGPEDPDRCRSCEAPLPASRDGLTRCVYCQADNLLEVDLRPPARLAAPFASELSSLWNCHAGRQAVWRNRAGWGLIALLLCFGLLAMGYRQSLFTPRVLALLPQGKPESLILNGPSLFFCTNGLTGTGILGKLVPDAQPEILASGLAGGQGFCLADGVLYWANQGCASNNWEKGSIQSLSLRPGSSVETLASAESIPCSLAVREGYCYWANSSGSIRRRRLSGGPIETLASGQPQPVSVAIWRDRVYWLNAGTAAAHYADGSLCCCPLQGGPVLTLAEHQSHPMDLVVSQAGLFWCNRGSQAERYDDGQICSLDFVGGPVKVRATDQSDPRNLILDGQDLYWSTWRGGTLVHQSLQSNSWQVLASQQLHPSGLVSDGRFLYWAEVGDDEGGRLMRCSLTGSGS